MTNLVPQLAYKTDIEADICKRHICDQGVYRVVRAAILAVVLHRIARLEAVRTERPGLPFNRSVIELGFIGHSQSLSSARNKHPPQGAIQRIAQFAQCSMPSLFSVAVDHFIERRWAPIRSSNTNNHMPINLKW